MKKIFILSLAFLLIQAISFGQLDTTKKPAPKITTQRITVEQEQWLRKNYHQIATIKKDSARKEIRKSFSSISDVSVDYMISRAGKLMQEDKQKHLAMVQQMMKSLTSQKNELTKKIADKERELKRTKDPVEIKNLKDEITEMKNKIKDLDKEIKYLRNSK